MRDKDDSRGKLDWNNDGVTGYTQGTNPRGNWVTENLGKTILAVIVIIVVSITVVAITADWIRDDTDDFPATNASEGN